MVTTLSALHRLQEIELELNAINSRIAAKQRSVEIQTRKLQKFEDELATQKQAVLARQMEADRFELDRKTREAQIDKFRGALNTAKTNKEYSAILTQINVGKADNAKVEEKVLDLLTSVDESQRSATELESQLEREQQRLEQVTQTSEDYKTAVQGKIAELEGKTAEAAYEVPPEALRIFKRVADRNDGDALARVVQLSPRRQEFICDGCNMQVPLEVVNAVMTGREVQQCPICGKILYQETNG